MATHPRRLAPELFIFEDDGVFPNSRWPALVYRAPVDEPVSNLADELETIFAEHGWTNSWRNGVYPFPHYHSTAHEALAVFEGSGRLQLGGPKVGQIVPVQRGDVIVIPAGVAHQRVDASLDFAVLGAYAEGRDWDLLRGEPHDRETAAKNLMQLPRPRTDPLFGAEGPLPQLWT
jgi:uncharacterized protein YjlB